MANIGSLTVSLAAKTDKFHKGLASARKSLSSFAGSVARIGVGAAIGAATIAMTALGLATRNAFREMDAAGKQADVLGIMTENLVALRRAADLAGTDSESLNKGLQRMNRSVGMASQGMMTQVRAFDALGLSIQDLMAMSTEERLGAIADGLLGIENSAMRATVAADIFGARQLNMLNVLAEGSAGLNEARKRADELGITYNRIDARKIEMANDAWTEMKIVLNGIGQQIALVVAPLMEKLGIVGANSLASINGEASVLAKTLDIAVNVVIAGVATVINLFNVVKYSIAALGGFVVTTAGFVVTAVTHLIAKVLEFATWAVGKFAETLSNVPGPLGEMAAGIAEGLGEATKAVQAQAAIWDKTFMAVSLSTIDNFKNLGEAFGDIFSGRVAGELRGKWDKLTEDFGERARKSLGNIKPTFDEPEMPTTSDISRTQRAGLLTAGSDVSIAAMAMSGTDTVDRDQLAEQKIQTKLQEQMLNQLRGNQVAVVGA